MALAEFAVSDSGIGVEQDKLGLLFQKFPQVDNSTTRNYGGSGLGLSIVRRLAELMDGEVGVESQLGQGSRSGFRAACSASSYPELVVWRARPSRVLLPSRAMKSDRNIPTRQPVLRNCAHDA